MGRWDELLAHLAMQPRENGSPALAQTADFLATTLGGFGIPVERLAFMAYPYRHRLCGIVAIIGTVAYVWAIRSRRRGLAIAIALISPTLILLELDYYVGWVTWPGAIRQEHVIARIAAPAATQRVILTAHYDTKTDLLDHVERAPVDLLSLPMTLMMIVAPLVGIYRSRGGAGSPNTRSAFTSARTATPRAFGKVAPPQTSVERITMAATLVYGLAVFLVLAGGAFVRQRSPGALDDGAACAVLVRVAETLARAPLARTDVEVALLSAEEIGVQGSRDFVQARLVPAPTNTSVINFEAIGASANLGVFGSERFTLFSYPPDPALLQVLDQVHRQRRDLPIYVTWYGASTDARSFLHAGIPALTLVSDLPEHALARGMHSAADSRDRIDEAVLDDTTDFVLAALRQLDAR